jgi:uncharacterized oxidoreductase
MAEAPTGECVVLSAERLATAVHAVVRAGGSDEYEAALVASNLVEANLAGHDSHGVGMVPRYAGALVEGGLVANRHPAVAVDAGALLSVDGQRGYGQVIGKEAIDLAIERARRHGSCIAAIANSHHLGRIGQWAEQAAAAGLVSIHFVNVLTRPIVAPWGGSDARHGTNPFCVGVPRRDAPPVVLDFATSRIAQGKTRVAHNRGVAAPEGAVIDDRGRPTRDPRFAVVPPFGALMPFGEHKGSGLALVCELLGGALTGGGTWHRPSDGRINVCNGMLSVLIDPAALGTGESLFEQTDRFVEWITASPVAEGFDRVRIAGEPEREMRAARLAAGIPIDRTTWGEILQAGAKLGVAPAEVERCAGL